MIRWIVLIALAILGVQANECQVPASIASIAKEFKTPTNDTLRNTRALKSLCVKELSFGEGKYHWRMLLVWNPKQPKGAFWYLPHDNENAAFDSAIYATQKYGGGFLSVLSNDERLFRGQDPNRNFGTTAAHARVCSEQKYPAPLYVTHVFKVINAFKERGYPYLTLHSNSNGYTGNGGEGHISMLQSSSTVLSYPAHAIKQGKRLGLSDEDSLIFIADTTRTPNLAKIKRFNALGINVKYEWVNANRNDCSMSHYVVLALGSSSYINIEVEHGDSDTQKVMIDKVLSLY